MFKKLLFCVLTIVVITAKSQFPSPYVVANIDFIKYYSQKGAAGSSPGAIDANGNVFTTGYTGLSTTANLVVLKYDSLGTQQYAYTYNNGSYDNGNAIKINASGYAYIAGVSTGTTGTLDDYIIIKLNGSGVSQWEKRFDSGISDMDEATAICVDANGDVYVTGKSKNSFGNFDILTYKLDGSTGNIIWTHIFDGGVNLDDIGTGIVLSANGSIVYITGNTYNSLTGSNIVTYALATSGGVPYWSSAVITNGTANGNDYSNGIILIGSDVVICGETDNSVTGRDYTTIKYNGSTGSLLWQKQYDNANYTNRATALVNDSAGNVGVVGTVYNGTTYEYHTVFYNSAGTQYTVNKESTGLSSLTGDPRICNDTIAHHWYVCGEKQMSTKDIFVYQITPTGNTSWRQNIDGQNQNVDFATNIAVNGVGVVYVGAQSKNSSANYDYTTIKLNQTPVYWPPDFTNVPVNLNHLYLKNMGQLRRTDSTLAKEVLYYTHNTTPEVFIEQNAFDFVYRKINSIPSNTNTNVLDTTERIQVKFLNCNPLAAQHEYVPRSTVYNYFLGYASSPSITDLQGNERIFIPNLYGYTDLHFFSDKQGLKYYMVLKPYATNENIMQIDGAQSVTIDGTTGNLKIIGVLGNVELKRPIAYTTNTLGAVVTLTGSASWVSIGGNKFQISLPPHSSSIPVIIQVSTANSTGVGYGAKANLDYSTFYGGQGTEVFNDIKAAANGDRYVGGFAYSALFPSHNSLFIYSADKDAVFLKYTSDDTLRVASFMGGASEDVCTSIEVNSSDQVFIGGYTSSLTFPTQTLSGASNQTVNGRVSTVGYYQDGFLAKFNPTLTPIGRPTLSHNWSRFLGGAGDDAINSIFLDGSGNLHFVGEAKSYTISGFSSGAHNIASNYSSDAIYGKFTPSLSMSWGNFLGGTGPSGAGARDIGMDITVDNNGKVIICGRTDATNLFCVNPAGTSTTNLFYYTSIKGTQDGFLARFSSSGTKDYTSYFGGNNIDAITRLVHDPLSDDIFFGGDSYDTTSFPFLTKASAFNSRVKTYRTAFIGQMGSNLSKKWSTYYGRGQNTSASTTTIGGMCMDGYGVLYVSGMTQNDTIQRPLTQPTTVVYKDSILNGQDGFVAIFNPNQSLYHAHYFGGVTTDQINGADISQNKKLYVVGNTDSNDFPIAYNSANATLIDSTYNGGTDGFISRFDLTHYQITGIKENNIQKSLATIYPNPTGSGFNLQMKSEQPTKVNLKVYNLMGQLIHEQEIEQENTLINCDSWANGVYLISVNDTQNQSTFKLIKN